MADISSFRMNQFIRHVNNNMPKETLDPPIQNEEEDKMFDDMVKELAEWRKTDPNAGFWPVESDW